VIKTKLRLQEGSEHQGTNNLEMQPQLHYPEACFWPHASSTCCPYHPLHPSHPQVEANKDRRERREPPPPPPELDQPLPTTAEGIDAFNAIMFNYFNVSMVAEQMHMFCWNDALPQHLLMPLCFCWLHTPAGRVACQMPELWEDHEVCVVGCTTSAELQVSRACTRADTLLHCCSQA
jgi:hypothetical protein